MKRNQNDDVNPPQLSLLSIKVVHVLHSKICRTFKINYVENPKLQLTLIVFQSCITLKLMKLPHVLPNKYHELIDILNFIALKVPKNFPNFNFPLKFSIQGS